MTTDVQHRYEHKLASAAATAGVVKSGDVVFLGEFDLAPRRGSVTPPAAR